MDRRQLLKQSALAIAGFAISRDVFAQQEYPLHLPTPADLIRLGSNENPHGPSPLARKAMLDAVNISNRYPWATTEVLMNKIAAQYGLTSDNVIIGAGSSEILGVVSLWAALKKGNAVAPDPTFRVWMSAARTIGLPIKLVPLATGKVVDLQRLKDSTDAQTKLIYICNPNNPTGTVIPSSELETFIRQTPKEIMILLDEAYTEFSDEPSLAKLVKDCPNLVVAKTFSKVYGMAGARVGFALAHQDTIKTLEGLQPWANAGASAVSLAGAIASLEDQQFVQFCKTENKKARDVFYSALDNAGMPYIKSVTSFVYFDSTNYKNDVKKILEAKQIAGARTFEDNTKWLRLSIGKVEEMEKVAAALNA